MPYLCLECGSLEWVEKQKVYSTYRAISDSEEKIKEEVVEVVDVWCANCDSSNLLYFSINSSLPISVRKEIANKMFKLKGKERIKFVLLVFLEDWDREFDKQRIIDEGDYFDERDDLIDFLKKLGVSEDEIMVRIM